MTAMSHGKNWEYSVIKLLHYAWNGIVLLKVDLLKIEILQTLGQKVNFVFKKYYWHTKKGGKHAIL